MPFTGEIGVRFPPHRFTQCRIKGVADNAAVNAPIGFRWRPPPMITNKNTNRHKTREYDFSLFRIALLLLRPRRSKRSPFPQPQLARHAHLKLSRFEEEISVLLALHLPASRLPAGLFRQPQPQQQLSAAG